MNDKRIESITVYTTDGRNHYFKDPNIDASDEYILTIQEYDDEYVSFPLSNVVRVTTITASVH